MPGQRQAGVFEGLFDGAAVGAFAVIPDGRANGQTGKRNAPCPEGSPEQDAGKQQDKERERDFS